jgi:hypothetical protein
MWIIKVALNRPYTFIVLALLILILSPIVILRTPTDIFPEINIPVIAVVWNFTGMGAEEMEGRMTSVYERILTTLVNNVEHVESMTVNGLAVVKVFLQPGASVDTANAQVTGASQTILRQMPPGVVPPLVLSYNASSVPILQLGLSSKTLTEQQLGDLGLNFIRTQLVTIPGDSVPYPYGGKQRQVMIDLNPALMQSKGVSPADVVNAFNQQNLIIPAGTAGEAGRRVDHLHTRRRPRARRLRPADQHRAAQRAARGIGFDSEERPRLYAGHRFQRAGAFAENREHAATGPQDAAAGGSVDLRTGFRQRCDSGSDHRRGAYRHHDPDLSRQLAKHGHHRDIDSSLDSDVAHGAERAGRNHQHHDPRRARAGCRHSGGRRDGDD